ncbi:ABC transporter permease [Homoserinimonas sp. A447]
MLRLIGKHLLLGVFVVWAALSATFALVRLSGDPVAQILSNDATQAQRDALREQLGLNKPVMAQYFDYLLGVVQGDFGRSYFETDSVLQIIWRHFENTAVLATAALVIVIVTAIPLGVIAAVRRGGVVDRGLQILAVMTASMPTFWVGLLLIQLFAVQLGLFPTYGTKGDLSLVLPATTLATAAFPSLARLTRSSMLDVLQSPYVRTARAKGMPEHRVVTRTIVRNGITPVISLLGLEIGTLFGGAVLTEAVFSWPGLGWLALRSIERRDFPIVQGIVVYVALIFVVVTILVEIAVRVTNPKLRTLS